MGHNRGSAVLLLVVVLIAEISSFSIDTTSKININYNSCNRRTALANFAAILPVAAASPLLTSASPATAANDAATSGICTVLVDSPDAAPDVGIQFIDTKIDSKEVPSVEKVEPNSLAAKNGVQPGMVLLGKDSATKSSSKNVDFRLRNGPYPFILQFATEEDMVREQQKQQQQQMQKEMLLDPYDGIRVKKVQKPPSCDGRSAKRGDTVTIEYEARITSSSGPLYDSSAWRQGKPTAFELGKGAAIPGVEIGLRGACAGEVREIDIPTQLGYGRYGSQVFDVPGDVRLWWRVELLDLTKGPRGGSYSGWKFK